MQTVFLLALAIEGAIALYAKAYENFKQAASEETSYKLDSFEVFMWQLATATTLMGLAISLLSQVFSS